METEIRDFEDSVVLSVEHQLDFVNPNRIRKICIDSEYVGEIPDLSAFTRLQEIEIRSPRKWTELKVLSRLPIRRLRLIMNKPGRMVLPELPDLEELYLCNEKPDHKAGTIKKQTVKWKEVSNLRKLILYGFSSIDPTGLSECRKLEELSMVNCSLQTVDWVLHLHRLKKLEIQNNQIEDINCLYLMKTLEYIDMSRNRITDISMLTRLPMLNYLDVSGNEIVKEGTIREKGSCFKLYISEEDRELEKVYQRVYGFVEEAKEKMTLQDKQAASSKFPYMLEKIKSMTYEERLEEMIDILFAREFWNICPSMEYKSYKPFYRSVYMKESSMMYPFVTHEKDMDIQMSMEGRMDFFKRISKRAEVANYIKVDCEIVELGKVFIEISEEDPGIEINGRNLDIDGKSSCEENLKHWLLTKGHGKEVLRNRKVSVTYVNLYGNLKDGKLTIATAVCLYAAMNQKAVRSDLVILGDMNDKGKVEPMSEEEIVLSVKFALEYGASRLLVPLKHAKMINRQEAVVNGELEVLTYSGVEEAIRLAVQENNL